MRNLPPTRCYSRRSTPASVLLVLLGLVAPGGAQTDEAGAWPHYAGGEGGERYSPLRQVNRENVSRLQLAWSYRTGEQARYPQLIEYSGYQATPILLSPAAGGHLVTCTPFNRVIALDPATGAERWIYDPEIDLTPYAGRFNCRGVTQWSAAEATAGEFCAHRIVLATNDRRLIALDAVTGRPCPDFGDGGQVDVTPIIAELEPAAQLRETQLLSPVAIVNDVIIIGSTANKFKDVSSMNGALRAFDVRTGAHLWTFDTLLRGEAPGAVDHSVGGANVWTTMSWDSERDLLFAPTASASPNYYGKLRPGDNLYANSILALRASTGELVWHFQAVRHDVWDWDIPTHPLLVDITRNGTAIPVVVVLTKTGVVFVLHRESGEPFHEIEDRPVPTDGIPGDELSPTQPFPVRPPPLMNVGISPDQAWGFGFFDRNACRDKIASMRHGGFFEPPSEQGTVMYPMVGGGMNWGGGAFVPEHNLLVTPVAQMPFFVRLIPNRQIEPTDSPMAGMPMGPPDFIRGAEYGLHQGPLMSPFFALCSKPPWAKVVAVDLAQGEVVWDRPLGYLDRLMPFPLPLEFGTPISGGGIATAGGLFFIGAAYDERFRAFDLETGRRLWEVKTPYSANATPMTYTVEGRQFIVVSAGGHAWSPLPKGDFILAYALPE